MARASQDRPTGIQNTSTQCAWGGHIHIMHFGPLTDLYGTPGAPKRARFGPKRPFLGPLRSSEGLGDPDLVPTVADWSNRIGHMVTTRFGLLSALSWAHRDPKRTSFGLKCPFWGPNQAQKYFLSEYSHVGCLNRRNGTPWSFNATGAHT